MAFQPRPGAITQQHLIDALSENAPTHKYPSEQTILISLIHNIAAERLRRYGLSELLF